MIVQEKAVSFDGCNNDSCAIDFSLDPSSQICSVSIMASNGFGASNRTTKNVGVDRYCTVLRCEDPGQMTLLAIGVTIFCFSFLLSGSILVVMGVFFCSKKKKKGNDR